MIPAILLTAATIVAIVCTALVLHPEYEDGLIGRVALSIFSVVATTRQIPESLDAIFDQTQVVVSMPGVVTWIALALFFARHWYRFYHARKGRYLRAMRDRRLHVGGGPMVQK